ncbi:MAG: SEC-C metal-binding domain-containing protein [Chlamydiota bacterium]
MTKVERNDPCPCKSGKKFKKCCGLPKQSLLTPSRMSVVSTSKLASFFQSHVQEDKLSGVKENSLANRFSSLTK